MSGVRENPNRLLQVIGILLMLVLLFPLVLMGGKMLQTYADLKDVRFQGERLLRQQQVLNQNLHVKRGYLSTIRTGFKPLDASTAQANATLQTRLRMLISSVGGNVETSVQVNINTDTIASLRPVSANVRWSVSEEGLARFLAKSAAPGQNLKIDSLLIRRRQGTASLLDIRMQCSALWQGMSAAGKEGKQ